MSVTRVLCLCCATYYESDCPHLTLARHSPELAARVARYLLDRGCEHPRPLDVRTALNALEAIDGG